MAILQHPCAPVQPAPTFCSCGDCPACDDRHAEELAASLGLDESMPYTAADAAWWAEETRDDGPEPDEWFDALYAECVADGWPDDSDCLPGRIG